MILILQQNIPANEITQLMKRLEMMQFRVVHHVEKNRDQIAILNGIDERTHMELFRTLPYVETILPFKHQFKLVGRAFKASPTLIKIKNQVIGGNHLTLIAGPCSIESESQMMQTAAAVAKSGAGILRGGAFKPRTSPYDYQGMGEAGLKLLQKAATAHNLLSISEVMEPSQIEVAERYVDILQIGARNMQNFNLLKYVGKSSKPVMLKRGLSATYREFLLAAEYIVSEGNPNVILCERGIRTFETYSRNTLDLAAVPILQGFSHLPVLVDPSHGTGLRHAILPMSLAAAACGANGIMVEVHPCPDKSVSDAMQAIGFELFHDLVSRVKKVKAAVEPSEATLSPIPA